MSEPERNSSSKRDYVFWIAVVCLLGFFVAIAIPNFAKPRSSGPANPCINIMRQMDAAKHQWVLENHAKVGDVLGESDLTSYIKLDSKGNLPKCPQGGVYNIGKVGEPITCSLGTNIYPPHILQPWP